MEGHVFDIQRYSIHDGPGIRTLVFLKGCPLRCAWCSNPESQQRSPGLFYSPAKCIHCHTCVHACPNHEIEANKDGTLNIHWDKVSDDLSWVDACPTEALSVKGKMLTVEEVMAEVRKDIVFYEENGGVTFSGGEPLLQADFVREIAKQCKAEHIGTAIETAGDVPWDAFAKVLAYMDLFLFDVKSVNSAIHKKWTGVDNKRILDNLQRLVDQGADIMVRTPLIPDVNDSKVSVQDIMDTIRKIGVKKYNVLPFHQYGSSKYEGSGMQYELKDWKPRKESYYASINAMIKEKGFDMEY